MKLESQKYGELWGQLGDQMRDWPEYPLRAQLRDQLWRRLEGQLWKQLKDLKEKLP